MIKLIRGLLVLVTLAVALPAFAAPASSRYEAATFSINAEETVQAERRQANSALIAQRRTIAARDQIIFGLRQQLRSSGQANRALERQIGELEEKSAAEKEAYTAELARLDDQYARERRRLIELVETWTSTTEGLEVLIAFNEGDWSRARTMMEELTKTRVGLRNEQTAINNAADLRAQAELFSQAYFRGQEHINLTIAAWEAVAATGKAEFSDWIILASHYEGQLRLDLALSATEEALNLARYRSDEVSALSDKGQLLGAMGRNSDAIMVGMQLLERRRAWRAHQDNVFDSELLSITLTSIAFLLCENYRCDEAQFFLDEAEDEKVPSPTGYVTGIVDSIANSQLATSEVSVLDTPADPNPSENLQGTAEDGVLSSTLLPAPTDLDSYPVFPAFKVDTRDTDLLKAGTQLLGDALLAEMLQKYQEAVNISREQTVAFPGSVRELRELRVDLGSLGIVLLALDDNEGLLQTELEVVEVSRVLAAIPGGDLKAQTNLSSSLRRAGSALLRLGRIQESESFYNESLEIERRLALSWPQSIQLRVNLADTLIDTGDKLLSAGNKDAARRAYEEALAIEEQLTALPGAPMMAYLDYARTLQRLGELDADPRYLSDALSRYQQVIEFQRYGHTNAKMRLITHGEAAQTVLDATSLQYAKTLLALGRKDEALEIYNKIWNSLKLPAQLDEDTDYQAEFYLAARFALAKEFPDRYPAADIIEELTKMEVDSGSLEYFALLKILAQELLESLAEPESQ